MISNSIKALANKEGMDKRHLAWRDWRLTEEQITSAGRIRNDQRFFF
jgi:hypothetical protein